MDDIDGANRLGRKPSKDVIVAPQLSVCSSWNGRNIRTFDGLLYRLSLNCAHTLVNDRIYGAFHVAVRSHSPESPLSLQIQWQSAQYTLENLSKYSASFQDPFILILIKIPLLQMAA